MGHLVNVVHGPNLPLNQRESHASDPWALSAKRLGGPLYSLTDAAGLVFAGVERP